MPIYIGHTGEKMFNPLKMAGDMKGMEKMLKPALEKFMNDSGFVKKSELEKLEERIKNLEREMQKKD
jgi:polyhydroxyalkanoate synthesis regulator phasin|tara:strand:- start:422 stop:622 length:201 start_codon:yes stop_codon:yes gene_type:complete